MTARQPRYATAAITSTGEFSQPWYAYFRDRAADVDRVLLRAQWGTYIDQGWPGSGYLETEAVALPSTYEWYTDNTKATRRATLSVTYSGSDPVTEQWKFYNVGGVLKRTVTDTITYDGGFEETRTRVAVDS